MTLYKALHSREDKLYVLRGGGKSPAIIEDCVDASYQVLEEQRKTNCNSL